MVYHIYGGENIENDFVIVITKNGVKLKVLIKVIHVKES